MLRTLFFAVLLVALAAAAIAIFLDSGNHGIKTGVVKTIRQKVGLNASAGSAQRMQKFAAKVKEQEQRTMDHAQTAQGAGQQDLTDQKNELLADQKAMLQKIRDDQEFLEAEQDRKKIQLADARQRAQDQKQMMKDRAADQLQRIKDREMDRRDR